jgi:hypothetical protein
MKRLLSKKGLIGAAGLSLIELIVSMAILATVALAIGGAMYVSSRSYARNSAEINVQEEAQIASNLICDWLVDAQEVSDTISSSIEIKHWENGELVTVSIFVDGNKLKYQAKNSAGSVIGSGVLASNVTSASFDPTQFETTRNVRFSIDFDVNDRTYHSVTDSTSRNHDFIADASGVSNAKPIIMFDIPPTRGANDFDVFLEPGQNDAQSASFTFNATVYNYDPSNTTFTVTDASGADVTCTFVNNGTNVFPITCTTSNKAKNNDTFTFTATKTITDPINGTVSYLVDTKTLTINVRRANECKFNIGGSHIEELGASDVLSGTHGVAGATYKAVSVGLGDHTYPRVIGAAYDNVFVDASTVKYYYRFADGTDASAYVNAVEVTTGSPSVQVTLAQNLTRDLYVVAVSTHQGDMPNDPASYNCGTTGDNKLRHTPFDIANWSYYDSVGKDKTYDVFKISATTPSPEPFLIDGGGFRRGTEAFRLGKMNDDFITSLSNKLSTLYPGFDPDDASTDGNLSYWTTLYYREVNKDALGNITSYGAWKSYVVGECDHFQNIGDYEMVKMVKDEASIFALNKDYQVKLQLDVWDSNLGGIVDVGINTCSSGTFPAVIGSVLNTRPDRVNSNNYIFETNAYSQNNPYEFTGSQMIFYTYFTGFDPKTIKIGVTYQVGTPQYDSENNLTGYNWSDYTTETATEKFDVDTNAFEESAFNVGGSNNVIKVRLADGTAYTIRNYNENLYPDPGVRVEKIKLDQNSKFESGKLYRICFRTNFDQLHVTSTGQVGQFVGGNPVLGTVGGTADHNWYDLTNADGTVGYIYIKKGETTTTTTTTTSTSTDTSTATLTYNLNGAGGYIAPVTVAQGTEVTLSDGTGLYADGKVFGGWGETADATEAIASPLTLTADKTVYAIWKPTVTLTYDSNGSWGGWIAPVSVVQGNAVTLNDGTALTPPNGKVFGGWGESANATEPIASPLTLTGNKTVYAIWKNAN